MKGGASEFSESFSFNDTFNQVEIVQVGKKQQCSLKVTVFLLFHGAMCFILKFT